MLSPKKLLENARNRIAKRENWMRGALAATAKTPDTDYDIFSKRVKPVDPAAVCWCSIGAVAAEAGLDDGYKLSAAPEYREAIYALARAAGYNPKDNFDFEAFSAIYEVNDNRGHESALELFDRAITNMKGE